jgi:hypothetical protein
MNDPRQRGAERGGIRRYLDTVKPEEYVPDLGEVDPRTISLQGLADLYGSDKGSIKHNYTNIYVPLLQELGVKDRWTHPLRIAEIGVACGASLRMWANHLPAASIEGFDIQPECGALCQDLANVKIFTKDPREIDRGSEFDLVIDDGSHIAEDILGVFAHCWRWVKPGGFYVIEDMACTYNDAYRDKFNKHFGKNLINDRNLMLKMWDALTREIDGGVGAFTEMRYHRQMWIFKR